MLSFSRSNLAVRPEKANKKSITCSMPIRIMQMLRNLASRTGIEPVSPP